MKKVLLVLLSCTFIVTAFNVPAFSKDITIRNISKENTVYVTEVWCKGRPSKYSTHNTFERVKVGTCLDPGETYTFYVNIPSGWSEIYFHVKSTTGYGRQNQNTPNYNGTSGPYNFGKHFSKSSNCR